jgi:hypothetical protein
MAILDPSGSPTRERRHRRTERRCVCCDQPFTPRTVDQRACSMVCGLRAERGACEEATP